MKEETKKFDEFKRDWWDPKGRLFSLHRINPLRFGYFSSKMKEHLGDIKKRVLDIGCGGGLLSEEFAKAGAQVTGIDLSPPSIEAAREHAKDTGLDIDYRVSSPGELKKEAPERFDAVICAEVLEHVDDLEGFLSDATAMLKKGGLFFFGTINRTLKARLLAIFVAEDILRMVPHGTHDYRRFVRPSELFELLKKNSVEVREVKGMSYDILRLEFKISDDTSVNYLGYGVKV